MEQGTRNKEVSLISFRRERQGIGNKEHRTQNKEHRTRNTEQGTQNKEHRTQNKEHRTQNKEHRIKNSSTFHFEEQGKE